MFGWITGFAKYLKSLILCDIIVQMSDFCFFILGGFLLRKKQAIRGYANASFLRYASERLRRPYYPCHS